MKKFNKDIGSYGENLSLKYLQDKNYTIFDKNFRNRSGELDIIAIKDDILIFIEVKTRTSNLYGFPSESVSYKKIKTIINLSKYYIHIKNLTSYFVRYDVIEIILNIEKSSYNINHITDAFRSIY
ncbi:MAG: YraN family protein [Sarcina sp.]